MMTQQYTADHDTQTINLGQRPNDPTALFSLIPQGESSTEDKSGNAKLSVEGDELVVRINLTNPTLWSGFDPSMNNGKILPVRFTRRGHWAVACLPFTSVNKVLAGDPGMMRIAGLTGQPFHITLNAYMENPRAKDVK